MNTESEQASATELRRQVKRRIEKLSTAKLRVADDFLAYLEERESSEATDELLNIPGFAESLAEAEQEIAAGQLTSASKLRRKS